MNVEIFPSVAKGKIHPPPSKSCAHRLLICAALSDGVSKISNIGSNDDILATIDCLKNLGADIDINGDVATVKGINISKKLKTLQLNCNESGSTLRFFIPLSLLLSEETVFYGSDRLLSRPQSVYEAIFNEQGCFIENDGKQLKTAGELKYGVFKMRGDVSSQFLTGLLFALPLLNGDSEIVLTTSLESAPYVDITIDVLSKFGVSVERKSESSFFIKGNQKYLPQSLSVECDWSNAAFLDAFNLSGGNVAVEGLDYESCQGDKAYKGFYEKIKSGCPEIDISDCPDLGPVLIAVSAICNGAVIKGTKRLKIKESDRGEAMRQELKKFGVDITVNEDSIVIPKAKLLTPTENLCCHNDHRIAMSLAVLCSVVGGVLENAQCVKKSYPEFFDDIKTLGIQYKII
ncbi:MAG: 3-phosphoshikimate 1-carboxyvinyltransferase [Clostridia bacterium]|nr:3-phosphoshikimate 1-carboxyvinyltransferase [Clostridia bacterium]